MMESANTLLEQMETLSDVFITVRAELAHTTLAFSELLDFEVGSVFQLPRPTGENIDVYAEDVLIGWGEVLLLDGAMTVRIADLRNALLPGLSDEEAAASEGGSSQEERGDD